MKPSYQAARNARHFFDWTKSRRSSRKAGWNRPWLTTMRISHQRRPCNAYPIRSVGASSAKPTRAASPRTETTTTGRPRRRACASAANEASAIAAWAAAAIAKGGALASKHRALQAKEALQPHGLPPPLQGAACVHGAKHRAQQAKRVLQPHGLPPPVEKAACRRRAKNREQQAKQALLGYGRTSCRRRWEERRARAERKIEAASDAIATAK